MKKKYQKPVLFAESFQLVDSIAANCGKGDHSTASTHPYQSATACTYTDGGMTLFASEGIGCDMTYYDEDVYQGDYDQFVKDMMSQYGVECYGAFSTGTPFLS